MVSESLLVVLRCPHCADEKEGLLENDSGRWLVCQEAACSRRYPIHEGIPIMLTKEGDFLGFRASLMEDEPGRTEDG